MTNPETELKDHFENTEQSHLAKEALPKAEISERKALSLPTIGLAGIVAISLLAGAVGGAFAALNINRVPALHKYAGQGQAGGSVNQKVNLTEDSAIIDVVKSASPAVVSIIISKNLNQVPNYGFDPFNFDPFSPFFGFGSGNSQQDNSGSSELRQVGAGSGFFVSGDGLILTNKHVVSDEQASYSVITSDGKNYDAKIMSRDPINDLAILKIDISNAPHLNLADSGQLQIGQRVIAIGNSLGQYQNTVTSGIVSGIGRTITAGSYEGSEQLSGVIQTDAAINPGNSGGPLLNSAGQVIGVNTAIDQQGQLVGFAIPANDVNRALASYQKNGRITRPFLGIRYVMITESLAKSENLPKDYGALILRGQGRTELAIIPGSPAEKAGLQENDIILEVNGSRLTKDNTLSNALKDHDVGDEVTLKIYHQGQEKTIKVALGEAK